MCAIAGILRHDRAPVSETQIARMLQPMIHRGPDDEGIYTSDGIGLGHRRLSILDLSAAGHQPMGNAEGSIWITYNGELYNYLELRLSLERQGRRFSSETDTEVILQAYEQMGAECLEQFNGMFAFAIWDARRRVLFCARDRIGIKPFYYVDDGREFIFASEIKALLALPQISPEPDLSAILDYLTFSHVRGDRTLFKRVHKLMPGEMLLVAENGCKRSVYWDVVFEESDRRPENALIEELTSLIDDAVRIQLRADVPVGTHLSGGMDSSLVTALARRHHQGPLFSFNGRFAEGPEYDESAYARAVADRVRVELVDVLVDEKQFVQQMGHLIWHMDEPAAGPGLYPQYFVCREARRHVTVALGGQGGDEVFVGYTHYRDNLLRSLALGLLRGRWFDSGFSVGDVISNLVRRSNLSTILNLLRGHDPLPMPETITRLRRWTAKSWKFCIPNAEVSELPLPCGSNGAAISPTSIAPLNWLLYDDIKHYLPSLLHVEDRTSMAVSLESRVPLLDHRIVEFMARVPARIKFPPLKHLLRKVAMPVLPDVVVQRTDKKGFSTPLMMWLKRLKSDQALADLLGAKSLKRMGIFRSNPLSETEDTDWRSWKVLNLELWSRIFLERSL